jgi:FkbM family methyltransferase
MTTFLWHPCEPSIQKIYKPVFLMNEDDSGRAQMFALGIPEKPLIEMCLKVMRRPEESTFIDIGAHMGAYSVLLSPHVKAVSAFEAQQRTFFQLCGNIFINELTNVTPTRVALVSPPEAHSQKTLHIVSEDGGGSTLIQPKSTTVLRNELVKTRTLDNYRIYGDVGMIKIDVEGYEYKVLLGASNTLKESNYPPILFESNSQNVDEELRVQLEQWGYKTTKLPNFPNMFLARQGEDL